MIPEQETYQQQLARRVHDLTAQLRAAEDELGQRRRQVAELTEQRDRIQIGGLERAALLEDARDLLGPWDGHGDAWPDIAPAIETLIAELASARAAHQATIVQARRWKTRAEAERNCTTLAAAAARREDAARAEQAEARITAARAECELLVAAVHGSHDEDDDATREVCGRITTILDGGQPCRCRPLDGCDCGMPITTETVRGGRRLRPATEARP